MTTDTLCSNTFKTLNALFSSLLYSYPLSKKNVSKNGLTFLLIPYSFLFHFINCCYTILRLSFNERKYSPLITWYNLYLTPL